GMGGLVQQPAALGAHRQHPAGRSRGTLLRHAGTTCHGGVTQTKWPPANPERFTNRFLNTDRGFSKCSMTSLQMTASKDAGTHLSASFKSCWYQLTYAGIFSGRFIMSAPCSSMPSI